MISDFKFHTFFSGFISKSKKTFLFDKNRFSFMYAKKTFPLKHNNFLVYQEEYNLGSICNLNKILLSLYLFLIYQLLN